MNVNMHFGIWVSLFFLGWTTAFAAPACHYTVDLTQVVDDRVKVEVRTPQVRQKKVNFHFPKIIPGTYTAYDFGRVVSHFRAMDRNGNELPVDHPDINTWTIRQADKLYLITYWVDDTYDMTEGKPVSGMSGTNIEEGSNFLLNGHGFFGYLEGFDHLPVTIDIRKPEGMYGSSAYSRVQSTGGVDHYEARDYAFVVDMPIMYGIPDTATIRIGDTEILISVHSPNRQVEAAYLAKAYAGLLQSQAAYLGGDLPVDRYAFLMYFMSAPLPIGTGALEHNYSSVYCLPEMDQDLLRPFLVDIAAHEFFHILTPLQLHSREIHAFDFNDPKMSRHLWLYEGVTEYFAHHNQVLSGMISREEFIHRMADKIRESRTLYQDDLPMTRLSKGCLDRYAHEYGNVYQKGALLAMCLDLELINWSGGTYRLIDLIGDLIDRYGPERPFRDQDLIRDIVALTGPPIRDFFDLYVTGDQPLDYAHFLNLAGIGYQEPSDTLVYNLGDVSLGLVPESGRLVVNGTYQLNEFGRALGYREGDELVSIQGQPLPKTAFGPFFKGIFAQVSEGDQFEVVVLRKEGGSAREVMLTAPIRRVRKVLNPKVVIREQVDGRQGMIRMAWLQA